MQYKNNYDILYTRDNGEQGSGIFNGDIGIIEDIQKKDQRIKIRFDDKTAVYDFDSAQDIELSYATTIHKSQGNEFTAVIIPLFNTPPMLCYRNLLYTGVTVPRLRSLSTRIIVLRLPIMAVVSLWI